MHTVTNFQLQGKACAERSLGYSPPLHRANRAKQFLGLKSRLPLTVSSSSFPLVAFEAEHVLRGGSGGRPLLAGGTLGLCARSCTCCRAEPARGRCCLCPGLLPNWPPSWHQPCPFCKEPSPGQGGRWGKGVARGRSDAVVSCRGVVRWALGRVTGTEVAEKRGGRGRNRGGGLHKAFPGCCGPRPLFP